MTPLACAADFKFVEKIVIDSGSSFAMGMKALPKEKRGYLFAIYAYCRLLDDIADEEGLQKDKLENLALWQEKVDLLLQGKPSCEVTRILHDGIQIYALPTDEFYHLIKGMKADVLGPIQGPTWQELENYCRQVAVSVGLLSIPIFGRSDEIAKQFAFELGHALQLTNILRDVAEDSQENRLYLPREPLEEKGISCKPQEAILADLSYSMDEVAKKTQTHYQNADRLLKEGGAENLQPALMMMAVYRKLFEKLQKRGWQTLSPRMRLSTTEKAFVVMKYLTVG